MKQKILVIAAHPDDEVLGCGGVIAAHVSAGDEAHVLVVSRGVPELFPPAVIEGTRQELREAHRILGVSDVQFLDFPAPRLDVVPQHELADAIRRVIHALRPQVVYTPHYGDIHGDHRAVYFATLIAARPVGGCSVRRLLTYETLSETDWAPPSAHDAFAPTVYVDITPFLSHKLAAMAAYRSQLKEAPNSRSLQSLEALAKLRGGTVGRDAAEAFMLVREIVE